jgi:hypothetical protein
MTRLQKSIVSHRKFFLPGFVALSLLAGALVSLIGTQGAQADLYYACGYGYDATGTYFGYGPSYGYGYEYGGDIGYGYGYGPGEFGYGYESAGYGYSGYGYSAAGYGVGDNYTYPGEYGYGGADGYGYDFGYAWYYGDTYGYGYDGYGYGPTDYGYGPLGYGYSGFGYGYGYQLCPTGFNGNFGTTTTTSASATTTTTAAPTTTTTLPKKPKPTPRLLGLHVYFLNDSAVISPHYKTLLRQLAAEVVADGTSHLTITGYANELGTPAINGPLSLARAQAVKSFLQAVLSADGDTSVSFTVSGDGVLKAFANLALDRVVVITG